MKYAFNMIVLTMKYFIIVSTLESISSCEYLFITDEYNKIIFIMREGYIVDKYSNYRNDASYTTIRPLIIILNIGDYLGLQYVNSLDHINQILKYSKILYLKNIHLVARYISENAGNSQSWTNYPLRLHKDCDGELYGEYIISKKLSYCDYVDTHRDIYKPFPRIVSLSKRKYYDKEDKEDKKEDIINVFYTFDDYYNTFKIVYKKYVAYSNVPKNRLKKNIRKHILKLAKHYIY
jgi:hypothetical protein